MTDPFRQSLIEAYIDAYNRFDIEGMLVNLSEGVRFEHHAGGELSVATDGKEQFTRLARVGAALFASRKQTLLELHEQGDVVTATVDFHGEIGEDIEDGPGAGTIIEMQGTSAFTFADGKIVSVIDRG